MTSTILPTKEAAASPPLVKEEKQSRGTVRSGGRGGERRGSRPQ